VEGRDLKGPCADGETTERTQSAGGMEAGVRGGRGGGCGRKGS